MIRIKSFRDGFRRCGVGHSTQWTTYPDNHFTDEQLAQLREEPLLHVEIVEGDEPDDEAGETSGGKSSRKNNRKEQPAAGDNKDNE